jgi:hypothetical protein
MLWMECLRIVWEVNNGVSLGTRPEDAALTAAPAQLRLTLV